jgi:prenylcysteine oxidase / farnesylcysteine lyase
LNITVFDRNSYIGGRTRTIHPYDNSSSPPIELGASIFVKVNHILWNAANEFNLTKQDFGGESTSVGIWNGKEFVLKLAGGWLDEAKLVWRYGAYTLFKAWNLRKATIGRFMKMYDTPTFPWVDLSQTVEELDLSEASGNSGDAFLAHSGITGKLADELLQSFTRVNYASNLASIHGLEVMVSFSTDGAVSIDGGNWQIFDCMVNASKSDVRLSTDIVGVHRDANDKFQLKVKKAIMNSNIDALQSHEPNQDVLFRGAERSMEFDSVVLAAPYQFAVSSWNVSDRGTPAIVPKEEPFRKLHVTLFTSPQKLSPAAFNLKPDEEVPLGILTTLQPDENPPSRMTDGKAGFLSLTMHGTLQNPQTGTDEYIYKIFSLERIGPSFFEFVLDVEAPSPDEDPLEVTWIHRHIWHSYPIKAQATEFAPVRLDQDIWYTAGIETFISTMETSALSGKNVARLMVDEWIMERESGAHESTSKDENLAQNTGSVHFELR